MCALADHRMLVDGGRHVNSGVHPHHHGVGCLTDKTVRNYVSAVSLKLDAADRTAVALKARDAGL